MRAPGPLPARLSAEPAGHATEDAARVADAADGDLVRQTREGNLDAFAVLADRHGPMAYRVALRLLGQHQDAEDVAQEALVTAWRQLPSFRAEASFSSSLYRIVVGKALNRAFRARATASFDLLGEAASAAAEPAQAVERSLATDAGRPALGRAVPL